MHPIISRRLGTDVVLVLLGACLVFTQACTPPAPTLRSSLALGDGIPHRPDLITVIPFEYAAPFENAHQVVAGFILIPAEIDGHQGTFLLDTGAGGFALNPAYLQPNPTGGIDTVRDRGDSIQPVCLWPVDGTTRFGEGRCRVTVHTVRVGTLQQSLAASTRTPPASPDLSNAILMPTSDNRLTQFGRPVLGWIGPKTLDAFETIIDYPHQRVILIRLDAAGHRLIDVPAFTSATEIPLVPVRSRTGSGIILWGVETSLGTRKDTLTIDTGAPTNGWGWSDQEVERLHRDSALAEGDEEDRGFLARHLVIGGQPFDNVFFAKEVLGNKVLGFPWLRGIGVVGFNFRTRRLQTYRAS